VTTNPEARLRVAGARAIWFAAGVLGLLLHRPWSTEVLLAIGTPWAVGTVLLAGEDTAARLRRAWREAISRSAGVFGAVGLGITMLVVVLAVAPGAAVLATLWLMVGLSIVGILQGSAALRSQLAGWSLLSLSVVLVLMGAEGVLTMRPVAERVGTPAEIDRWNERYDRLWDRNVLGIRSPYETVRKAAGVERIVVLGDSFTWGDKIASSDSTWPAQLEQQLRDGWPGRRIEVVNLGRNGFTTVNAAEMLRRLGWQFEPDLVLVQFYMNDILPSRPNFGRQYSAWLFPEARILPTRYRHGRLGRSALLHMVEGTLTGLRHGDRAARAGKWTELYRDRGAEWNALAEALTEMGRAAAERNVPIVLVLFPDFLPGVAADADPPFQSIHDQVATAARAAGFSILDLTPHYLREGGDLRRWWATPYDAHPNEAAARLAATSVADHLRTYRDSPN
jgi:lysophospholipase L1-like esterase